MNLRYEKERLLIAGLFFGVSIMDSRSFFWRNTKDGKEASKRCFELADELIEIHYEQVKLAEQERREKLSKALDEIVVNDKVSTSVLDVLDSATRSFTDAYKQPIELEPEDEG